MCFFLLLLPCVAWPQESSLAKNSVFRAARKAQQEGRLANAEEILNDRIHEIESAAEHRARAHFTLKCALPIKH
jgi:hypothetical protein